MRRIKRIDWIDSCRFLAMFWILIGHFLATFYPSALSLWDPGPFWWLFGGFPGKLAFTLYFVLLGYFASKPKPFSLLEFIRYTVRRYLMFVFFSFLATLIFIFCGYIVTWIFHTPNPDVFRILSDGPQYNLTFLLRDAFYLEDHYIDSFWCMKDLFIASIMCRLFGYLPEKGHPYLRALTACMLIVTLMLLNSVEHIWICVALMGCLLRLVLEQSDDWAFLKYLRFRFLILLFTIAILKIPIEESPLLFFLEGILDSIWVLLIAHSPRVQFFLSHPPLPYLGKLSMGIFVIHTPVYCLLQSSLFPLMLGQLPNVLTYLFCFLIGVFLTILGAWILHRIYDAVSGFHIRRPITPG